MKKQKGYLPSGTQSPRTQDTLNLDVAAVSSLPRHVPGSPFGPTLPGNPGGPGFP